MNDAVYCHACGYEVGRIRGETTCPECGSYVLGIPERLLDDGGAKTSLYWGLASVFGIAIVGPFAIIMAFHAMRRADRAQWAIAEGRAKLNGRLHARLGRELGLLSSIINSLVIFVIFLLLVALTTSVLFPSP